MAVPKRLIAIGDIHGELDKLNRLLNVVQATDADKFVFLGDYVDRGKNSKGVIERLIQFQTDFPQTIFIRGNHYQILLDALIGLGVMAAERLRDISRKYEECSPESDLVMFLSNGGSETLRSYRLRDMTKFPVEHIRFWQRPNTGGAMRILYLFMPELRRIFRLRCRTVTICCGNGCLHPARMVKFMLLDIIRRKVTLTLNRGVTI